MKATSISPQSGRACDLFAALLPDVRVLGPDHPDTYRAHNLVRWNRLVTDVN